MMKWCKIAEPSAIFHGCVVTTVSQKFTSMVDRAVYSVFLRRMQARIGQ